MIVGNIFVIFPLNIDDWCSLRRFLRVPTMHFLSKKKKKKKKHTHEKNYNNSVCPCKLNSHKMNFQGSHYSDSVIWCWLNDSLPLIMFLASVGQIATLLHTLGTFETLKAIEFLQLIIFAHCNVYPSSLKFSYCMLHIVCACPNNDTPTLVQHESYLPLRFELYHLQCSANCLKDFDPLFFSYCISWNFPPPPPSQHDGNKTVYRQDRSP